MIWLYFMSSTVCVFAVLSSELKCPQCNNDCGDVGFISCEFCQCAPSCDSWPCNPGTSCVLEDVKCIRSPCPRIPSCVDLKRTCKTPLYNDDTPIICNVDNLHCPPEYLCTPVLQHSFSICCKSPKFYEPAPPSIAHPAFPPFSPIPPIDIDDNENCHCELDPCESSMCPSYPHAHCISDLCSCSATYINEEEEIVQCFEDENNMRERPPFLDLPRDDPNVSPVTNQSSQLPATDDSPNNLASHSNNSSHTPFNLVGLLIGVSVTFFVVGILCVAIVLYHRRKKPPAPRDEEQLKPLNASNGVKMISLPDKADG